MGASEFCPNKFPSAYLGKPYLFTFSYIAFLIAYYFFFPNVLRQICGQNDLKWRYLFKNGESCIVVFMVNQSKSNRPLIML